MTLPFPTRLASDLLPNQNAWSTRLSVSCRREPGDGFHERFHAQPARMLLTQGFIARHADGGTAILGRGGSDTSAAYFGALPGAQRVDIWTAVPGSEARRGGKECVSTCRLRG